VDFCLESDFLKCEERYEAISILVDSLKYTDIRQPALRCLCSLLLYGWCLIRHSFIEWDTHCTFDTEEGPVYSRESLATRFCECGGIPIILQLLNERTPLLEFEYWKYEICNLLSLMGMLGIFFSHCCVNVPLKEAGMLL